PIVFVLVRRAFPDRPALVLPFAFAVFMAAGVAPLVVSNPMNMVMASRMGIDFNTYAIHMVPISIAGSIASYLMLRLVFRGPLAARSPRLPVAGAVRPLERAQRHVLALLAGSLLAYPILAFLGGPVWLVAVAVAVVALLLARLHAGTAPLGLIRGAVAWEVLAFLAGAFLIALGLHEVGLVDRLTEVYAGSGPTAVGACSAVGSALLNNHPMSQINMLALGDAPAAFSSTLAAMVGGDLGPRLFPLGSLAGLLWLESLRRQRVALPVIRFVTIGVVVTLPALVISLAIVAAYGG
ncbi:MAG: ArsB/NhaD family transporter, partial [Actinomycetota bacterium]